MKQILSTLGALLVLNLVVAGGAAAQTPQVGPYYATPSLDQTLGCPTLTNCPRFVVLSNYGNSAVLDRETGLVWQRTGLGIDLNWFEWSTHCTASVADGGKWGWRLPTVTELSSLVGLPPGHPFSWLSSLDQMVFWSATTAASNDGATAGDGSQVWVVDLDPANPSPISVLVRRPFSVKGWCVRSPQNLAAQ